MRTLISLLLLLIAFAVCQSHTHIIRRATANTVNAINRGSSSIRVGFFKNVDPYQPSFQPKRTINVAPETSQVVPLDQGWEGRVQKLTGAAADPATWAEIHFDAYMGMDLYPDAPYQFKTKDAGGYNVLQPTQPYSGGTNLDLVKYYREKVPTGDGYILPDDHASSYRTNGKTINLAIY